MIKSFSRINLIKHTLLLLPFDKEIKVASNNVAKHDLRST